MTDKHSRREAILDAAAQLLACAPDRLASMAEVADAAGVAKGTVYLYFASKEELWLALHERGIDALFADLARDVARSGPLELADIARLTTRHLLDRPTFLPLAARCLGLMAHSVSPAAAAAFEERMMQRLQRAGLGLERPFPQLGAGGGVTLLRRTCALVIGLWQLSGPRLPGARDDSGDKDTYAHDLADALTALWHGSIRASDAL